ARGHGRELRHGWFFFQGQYSWGGKAGAGRGAGRMGKESQSVYVRALRRAADILGEKQALRAALHVPLARLDEWLAGKSDPPMDIFLKAVDIISAPVQSAPPPAAMRARILSRESAVRIRRSQRILESSQERVARFL